MLVQQQSLTFLVILTDLVQMPIPPLDGHFNQKWPKISVVDIYPFEFTVYTCGII